MKKYKGRHVAGHAVLPPAEVYAIGRAAVPDQYVTEDTLPMQDPWADFAMPWTYPPVPLERSA